MSKDRVAIVGVGNVGATTAYALLLSGLAPDIVLINRDRKKAEGEAEDISHAEPWSHTTLVRAGGFEDCATAKVIVVAVGAGLAPGETRLDLLKKNAAIFRDLIPKIAATRPKGILLIATNPVDALTHYARKLSGFEPNRVVGSGTILDTARLRVLLGDHYGVDPQSVHAYSSASTATRRFRYGPRRELRDCRSRSSAVCVVLPTTRRRWMRWR